MNLREEEETIKIYITGEIKNPGVIELKQGDRIEDAINKAGGLTEFASLKNINLAYQLSDGMKISIPNINFENEEVSEDILMSTTLDKININTASTEKLMELPGVGEAVAEKIIDYRNKNGKFNSKEDLKNVSGIGEKKYESLEKYITTK